MSYYNCSYEGGESVVQLSENRIAIVDTNVNLGLREKLWFWSSMRIGGPLFLLEDITIWTFFTILENTISKIEFLKTSWSGRFKDSDKYNHCRGTCRVTRT